MPINTLFGRNRKNTGIMILEEECTLMQYTREVQSQCEKFTCGEEDLDSFFQNDAFLYEEEMLGKTYCWVTNAKPHVIVCLVTIANDSIKSALLPKNSRNRFNRIFNNEKRNLTYPATLIGRLGVNLKFQGQHIGQQLMNYLKDQNVASNNDNACRFLVVDAYNDQSTLAYYERNGFVYMHKTEEVERAAMRRFDEEGRLLYEIPEGERLLTRMMYFDLKKM